MENQYPPEEVYQEEPYEVDDGTYTQQVQVVQPAKPPAHEIKSLAAALKILSVIRGDIENLYERYAHKYQLMQEASNAVPKRPVVGKKQKQKLFINSEFFAEQYRKFFLMPVMDESSLENNLKVFFEGSRLKENVNPADIGITEEEFEIYKIAVAQNIQGYFISEKDIPLLIRRMFKPAGVCSVTGEDGTVTSFDAASFIGASRQFVLDCLESNRLISYDRTDAPSSFSVSKRLPKLLNQIPLLKPLNLEATQMENYLSYESFIKLIDMIRDKNELYKQIVDTDRAKQIVEKLSLPDINGFYKPEAISAIIKTLNLKKEEFFKDVNRVITGLSVVPLESNLLN